MTQAMFRDGATRVSAALKKVPKLWRNPRPLTLNPALSESYCGTSALRIAPGEQHQNPGRGLAGAVATSPHLEHQGGFLSSGRAAGKMQGYVNACGCSDGVPEYISGLMRAAAVRLAVIKAAANVRSAERPVERHHVRGDRPRTRAADDGHMV